jgi:hypothetical protein
MLPAVDLGCRHQVLMSILLQQASIHVMVSNDGHHTMKAQRYSSMCFRPQHVLDCLPLDTEPPLSLDRKLGGSHSQSKI